MPFCGRHRQVPPDHPSFPDFPVLYGNQPLHNRHQNGLSAYPETASDECNLRCFFQIVKLAFHTFHVSCKIVYVKHHAKHVIFSYTSPDLLHAFDPVPSMCCFVLHRSGAADRITRKTWNHFHKAPCTASVIHLFFCHTI